MATNNTTSKGPTKAELQAEIAQLKALLAEQSKGQQSSYTAPAPNVTFTVPSTDVTIVYCSNSLGCAKISNLELLFNKFGEEFTLSRIQFDELVGKYRKWFDEGILAVSSKNLDIAAAKGLKTDNEFGLTSSKLANIGKLSLAELEELWNETTLSSHRHCIVSFYKDKFISGDPDFVDRAKIDLMNRLTNGAFAREQDEISGRYKILPTEM